MFELELEITENIVVKNTPTKFIMDQKKSVIVFNRQNDLLDLTTPEKQNSFGQKNMLTIWIDE